MTSGWGQEQLTADHGRGGEDVDGAVTRCRLALRGTPVADPRRAPGAEALGDALARRFHLNGDPVDLDDAIAAYRDALKAPHADQGWNRVACQVALADLVARRYARTGRRADLDEAIIRYRTAVRRTRPAHPTRTAYLIRLADALTTRGKLTGSTLDLAEAADATAESTP